MKLGLSDLWNKIKPKKELEANDADNSFAEGSTEQKQRFFERVGDYFNPEPQLLHSKWFTLFFIF